MRVALTGALLLAGCSGTTMLPGPPPSTPPPVTAPAPATVSPAVTTSPSVAASPSVTGPIPAPTGIAAGRRAAEQLGTITGSTVAASASGAMGRGDFLGRARSLTAGQFVMQVTCVGPGSITFLVGAPAAFGRLHAVATPSFTPDATGGTLTSPTGVTRAVVDCGTHTLVVFDAGPPGPGGLDVRLSGRGTGSATGFVYQLRRVG